MAGTRRSSAPWAFQALLSAWPSHTFFFSLLCVLVNHQEIPPGLSMVASSWPIAEDRPPAVVIVVVSVHPINPRYDTRLTHNLDLYALTHSHTRNGRSSGDYVAVPFLCLRTCGGLSRSPGAPVCRAFLLFRICRANAALVKNLCIIHDNATDWPARHPKGVAIRPIDCYFCPDSQQFPPGRAVFVLTVHDGSGFPAPRSFGMCGKRQTAKRLCLSTCMGAPFSGQENRARQNRGSGSPPHASSRDTQDRGAARETDGS